MISIVYSTRKIDNTYNTHLKEMVGIKDIEIIVYENNREFSLSELYNKGLNESKNNIVVFIHDDLIFNNKWGRKVLDHFKNTDFGILGLAGTTDLSIINGNSAWWSMRNRMVGSVKHTDGTKTWESRYSKKFDIPIEVCLVDGLFIAVSKERIKENFDEDFKGFHYYDIPFCVRNYSSGVKIGVISDVDVTHKSVGQTNKEWLDNMLFFNQKYANLLPINVKAELFYDKKNIKTFNPSNQISIIIPTKNKIDILIECINSILETTKQSSYEIVIADTGSSKENREMLGEYVNNLPKNNLLKRIKIVDYTYYNFAKINNDVVKNHIDTNSDTILFCNNDVKLLNDAVDRANKVILSKKDAGCVGIRLHFADNSIQHNGILFLVKRQNNQLLITHNNLKSFYNYTDTISEPIGNTGAFLMIKRNLFEKFWFNENYKECFEDVELNLNCLVDAKVNYHIGDAVAYHYESLTRNDSPEKNKKSIEDYTNTLIPFIKENYKSFEKKVKMV